MLNKKQVIDYFEENGKEVYFAQGSYWNLPIVNFGNIKVNLSRTYIKLNSLNNNNEFSEKELLKILENATKISELLETSKEVRVYTPGCESDPRKTRIKKGETYSAEFILKIEDILTYHEFKEKYPKIIEWEEFLDQEAERKAKLYGAK